MQENHESNDVLYAHGDHKKRYQLANRALTFADTIAKLRSPNGCPWDKEQTLSSLQPYLIEESYEAIEALNSYFQNSSQVNIKKYADELGDVLLQIFLNSQIAAEQNLFDVAEVFSQINEKMLKRHPHVFSNNEFLKEKIKSATDVVDQWETIKTKETEEEQSQCSSSLLKKAVKKRAIPTLNFGAEISKRAKQLGFSWNTLPEVFADVLAEIKELQHEIEQEKIKIESVADEIGDIVYALCNLVQFFKETNAEAENFDFDLMVRAAIDKFINRFFEMEKIMQENGSPLSETSVKNISLDQWNDLWKQAKKRRYR